MAASGLLAAGEQAARIAWRDVAAVRTHLEAHGITSDRFESHIERIRQANLRRVREGDLDHLVFYLLQSTRFTSLPAIEPALSAKALVEGLDPEHRDAFLRSGEAPPGSVPGAVRSRVGALLRALDSPKTDVRLTYFRSLVSATLPDGARREAALLREYLRAMRFLYEKEFVAQQSPRADEAVAELYRTRGLSTDTAIEAGFLVYQGLGVLGSLDPSRRIRRVLIVGPGLDLAPRTALDEAGSPESYQPWAVADALLALGLSRSDDLELVAADINPRVVQHIDRAGSRAPTLTLASEIHESDAVRLSQEYRDYFARLGNGIGEVEVAAGSTHLRKTVRVRPEIARRIRAAELDIVVERLHGPAFDVVVATNVLPYLGEAELPLALTNIAAMLAPDGAFLHNEARPSMHELTTALSLPLAHSRHAVIASVKGARAPLADSVWLHRKAPAVAR